MISITLNQLAKVLSGKTFGSNVILNSISIDTRKIISGCLFIALKGKNFNAHDFSKQAKEMGARALLVNQKINIDLPQVIVEDTRLAFFQLAAWVRQQVSTNVVALTGSSGKTSVKEMTAKILRQCGNTLCTIDNLNNEIGVSMTLLNLTKEHDYAVIELGANHPGEIAFTANLTRPKAALVNNFTVAHIEGFGSLEGVAKAKGEIYSSLSNNGIAIINSDSNDLSNWKSTIQNRKIWNFSLHYSNKNDFGATDIYITTHSTKFTLHTPKGSTNILLPLVGLHNVSNALAASSLSMAVGASLTEIQIGLNNFKSIPGRLFPILISKNKLLLDDSYNANFGSMKAAIQVLNKMPGYRVMVLGDIAELGNQDKFYHEQIGKIIKISGINQILSIGVFSQIIAKKSGIGESFSNKSLLITRLKKIIQEHQIITILVKGSRCFAMEEIVYALQEKTIC